MSEIFEKACKLRPDMKYIWLKSIEFGCLDVSIVRKAKKESKEMINDCYGLLDGSLDVVFDFVADNKEFLKENWEDTKKISKRLSEWSEQF